MSPERRQETMPSLSRRRLLSVSATGVAALAGCTASSSEDGATVSESATATESDARYWSLLSRRFHTAHYTSRERNENQSRSPSTNSRYSSCASTTATPARLTISLPPFSARDRSATQSRKNLDQKDVLARYSSCASTTATPARFTMSLTSSPRWSTWTGLSMPTSIGPMASAPPRRWSSL